MQSRNPFFDDLSRLMTSAAGVAQGARNKERDDRNLLSRSLNGGDSRRSSIGSASMAGADAAKFRRQAAAAALPRPGAVAV